MNRATVKEKTMSATSVSPFRAPRIADICVREAMHEGVLSCTRDTSLVEVARLMASHHIHCVVVCDSSPREGVAPWGVVSDLDLVAAAMVRPLSEQTAEGSAASPVVGVMPDDTLERAAQLMTEHATAHLLVIDGAPPQPVGVLSTLDVAASLGGGPDGRAEGGES
jgi:CBS domain-containing protein